MHSAYSDGTEPPADVVAAAHAAGMGTMALTDHDTTLGWTEAASAAASAGMTFLPGMELSTRFEYRSIHILAYLFDPTVPALVAELEKVRADRLGRAERIVRNISADYPLTWADVLAHRSDGASVGRPHIADALITRGLVADREEAFADILHPRTGYVVPLYAPDPITGVRLISEAGGVAVMAHPSPAGRGRMLPVPVLEELIDAGLAGFEIGHRENTEEGKRVLRRLADAHDLIVTGSSDYHGSGKPNRAGENTTDDAAIAAIIERASGTAPVYPT